MACATLKRSLEFDPVHSHGRPNKRRRCVPMCVSPGTSAQNTRQQNPSPFGEVAHKLTPEKMFANIREEIRRLHRRKQVHFNHQTQEGDSSDMEGQTAPSCSTVANAANSDSSSRKEKPMFTFTEVGLICERMLKEQEIEIRQEYDTTLHMKLSEQYDAFVKFTYDQIHKKYESAGAPSYLS